MEYDESDTAGMELAGGTMVVEDVAEDSDADEAARVEVPAAIAHVSAAFDVGIEGA